MPYVVQMVGYDPVAAVEKTVRFAMGPGIAFTDQPYAVGALKKWSAASQKIGFSANGAVELSGDAGQLVLSNVPDENTSVGPLDYLLDWIWQNRAVDVFYVPGDVWAARTRMGGGVLQQPVANMSVSSGLSSTLTFPIRDPRSALETPLQPAKYLGTNVGPAGIEGGENLKGRPKPVILGLVSNLTPPLVNESLLIYQIADRVATILCVRDGGVRITPGVQRANIASLQANIPASGTYDYVYDLALGAFFRLGTTPIFGITVDADEAAAEFTQSHPYIWARLRQRVTPTVSLAGADEAHVIDPNGAGFYWDIEISQKDALDEVLRSFSGYEVQGNDGIWRIGKLVVPSGTPVLELEQLTPSVKAKAKTRYMLSMNLARPQYRPDGSPPYRVVVRWGRNYTVMNKSDFAGSAILRLREKFSAEYRDASAVDLTIWNPTTQVGPWKNAPELTIDTAYQPGPNGLTSPGAEAEAARLLALFKPDRKQIQTTFLALPGDAVLVGDVVKATYPRAGMAAGSLFRVLESGLTIENDKAEGDLVMGLQV